MSENGNVLYDLIHFRDSNSIMIIFHNSIILLRCIALFFEKEAFFYWLDEGLIEISLSAKTSGTWRTISSGTSAQAHT